MCVTLLDAYIGFTFQLFVPRSFRAAVAGWVIKPEIMHELPTHMVYFSCTINLKLIDFTCFP